MSGSGMGPTPGEGGRGRQISFQDWPGRKQAPLLTSHPAPTPWGSSRMQRALSQLLPRPEACGPARRTLQGVAPFGAPRASLSSTADTPVPYPAWILELSERLDGPQLKGRLHSWTCPEGPLPSRLGTGAQATLCQEGPAGRAKCCELSRSCVCTPISTDTMGQTQREPQGPRSRCGEASAPSHGHRG